MTNPAHEKPSSATREDVNRAPSKERLMHLLAEAAELEHNLLCSYLFALFSLKESADEEINEEELAIVDRWRASLLTVCVEEMTHLAQVANLTVAIGGRPHLNRPNIPVAAGYHPASVVVELTPLDLDTLNHFVFLERPDGESAADGESFRPIDPYLRREHSGDLMPSSPNYETIGEFYGALADEFRNYSDRFGGAALFSGPANYQLRAQELHTDTLSVVTTLDEALAAIDEIVREGEGSPAGSETSHFALFVEMRDEFMRLVANRPAFRASRDVGRNSVMHAPIQEARTHIIEPSASMVLDAANAVYGLMLRCLARCFETAWDRTDVRTHLVKGCMGSMRSLSVLGRALTRMDAAPESSAKAGVSFAMLRSMQGWLREEDSLASVSERARDICAAVAGLSIADSCKQEVFGSLSTLTDGYTGAR